MDAVSGSILASGLVVGFGTGWLSSQVSNPLLAARRAPDSPPSKLGEFPGEEPNKEFLERAGISSSAYDVLWRAPIGYLEVDVENQLLWINPTACEILGIACDASNRLPLPRLLLELVRSYELDQLIERTRQAQTPHQEDWVLNLVSPDPINPNSGKSHPLRGYGIPLAENHVGVYLENRQEATTLIQQRDRWTSDVAHELKTPLTSIRLVAETLRDRVDPSLTKWLDRLLNEILRLSNLVEDLLNLSRLKRSGGTGLVLKPVELPRLLFAAWQSLEPLADIKYVQIKYEGTSNLIVTLDETLMYRVFINLIDNAIKYSPPEGTITVRAMLQDKDKDNPEFPSPSPMLLVEVIDEGTGFREVDIPHIFSRFYRSDPSRSRPVSGGDVPAVSEERLTRHPRSTGTGLGLAIVQQIVEAHGGTTQASNHPQTGGGWLTLSIPVSSLSLEGARLSAGKPA